MGPKEKDEIEITPKMIEAGLGPLMRFSREKDLYEEVVREIYCAMEKVGRYGSTEVSGG
jgi:DNA gyrase inhibitor GyrI